MSQRLAQVTLERDQLKNQQVHDQEWETQCQRYEERIVELHSVIAELSRKLNIGKEDVIPEESECEDQKSYVTDSCLEEDDEVQIAHEDKETKESSRTKRNSGNALETDESDEDSENMKIVPGEKIRSELDEDEDASKRGSNDSDSDVSAAGDWFATDSKGSVINQGLCCRATVEVAAVGISCTATDDIAATRRGCVANDCVRIVSQHLRC